MSEIRYDGRVAIRTVQAGDRTVKSYSVGGLPAGTVEEFPFKEEVVRRGRGGRRLRSIQEGVATRVTSVLPGYGNIMMVKDSRHGENDGAQLRLDDIRAIKDPEKRKAALDKRIAELTRYIDSDPREWGTKIRWIGSIRSPSQRDIMTLTKSPEPSMVIPAALSQADAK